MAPKRSSAVRFLLVSKPLVGVGVLAGFGCFRGDGLVTLTHLSPAVWVNCFDVLRDDVEFGAGDDLEP